MSWLSVLAILALCAPLFFYHAGRREITTVVEARVAITAREMWRAGEWILPTMNGELRLQKPPLAYWLAELCAMMRGRFDDLTLRLPFAVLMAGTALFLWRTGALLAGSPAGLLAAVVLLTSSMFVKEGHMASPDATLLFATSGAWYFYLAARDAQARSGLAGGKRLLYYLFLGLGSVAKGPVILLLAVVPPLVEAASLRTARPLRPLWSPAGIVLFLILSSLWPVLVLWRLPAAGDRLVAIHHWYLESFGKVLPSEGIEQGYRYHRHSEPWHFYFPRLFAGFGPWGLVLLLILWRELSAAARSALAFLRGRRIPTAPGGAGVPAANGLSLHRVPTRWFLVIFFSFFLLAEKKDAYLLPLLPLGALMVSSALEAWYSRYRPGLHSLAGVLAAISTASFVVVLVAVLAPARAEAVLKGVAGEYAELSRAVLVERPGGVLVLTAIACCGFFLFRQALRGEQALTPFLILGAGLVLATACFTDIKLSFPSSDGKLREGAQAVAHLLEPDEPLYTLGSPLRNGAEHLPGGLAFYLDRRIVVVAGEHAERLAELPPDSSVVLSEHDLKRLGASPDCTDGSPILSGFAVRQAINPDAKQEKDRNFLLQRVERLR